jgi:hypothetical protein
MQPARLPLVPQHGTRQRPACIGRDALRAATCGRAAPQVTAASLIAPDTAKLREIVYGGTGETERVGGADDDSQEWSGVSVGAFSMPIKEAEAVS